MHHFQTQSLQGWERKPSDPGIFASSQNWCLELNLKRHRSYDINSRGKIPFHSKIKLSEFSNSRGKESTQGVRESDKTNGQCYWLLWDMCSNLIETWYIKTLQCFWISFAGLGITTRMTLPCFEASHDASGGTGMRLHKHLKFPHSCRKTNLFLSKQNLIPFAFHTICHLPLHELLQWYHHSPGHPWRPDHVKAENHQNDPKR